MTFVQCDENEHNPFQAKINAGGNVSKNINNVTEKSHEAIKKASRRAVNVAVTMTMICGQI